MRRSFTVLLIFCILVGLAGCDNLGMPVLPTEKPPELTLATTVPAAGNQPATEQPRQTEATEASSVPPEEKCPYLQRIPRDDFPIREGPGYDWLWAGTVKEQGTYTIVAEEQDAEGNLWGKLKSGAGWVDLTLLAEEKENPPLVTVSCLEGELPQEGGYHYYEAESAEYSVTAAFCAYGVLTEVTLFRMDAGDPYKEGDTLFSVHRWESGELFVAELLFPGSMSMYGLRVTDPNGAVHTFTVTQSGRNGDIVLAPFSP